jgi:hypothetical protein
MTTRRRSRDLPIRQLSEAIHGAHHGYFVTADEFGAGDAIFPDLARQALARGDAKAESQEEARFAGESEDVGDV